MTLRDKIEQALVERRGGPNRVRILSALDERPQNANRLAENLNLHYKTVRHHLDVLEDTGLLQCSGEDYGAVYLLNDQGRHCLGMTLEFIDQIEPVEG